MNQCSLIVSTYNWPAALSLCLKSIIGQTVLPAEIIVADDGSKEETRQLIDGFRSQTVIPILHVWHPDEGFQLSRIRNRAIARASQPYIIQVDGDLILHKNFIADHLHICESGYFVSGSRVLLSATTSATLLQHNSICIPNDFFGSKNLLNKLRNRKLREFLATRYKTKGNNRYYVKGCNMAFWKADLVRVNGYNETFTGWGREDSELAIRLINAGVNKKFLKMGGITFHLYHKEASRENETSNIIRMNKAMQTNIKWAEPGLNQYMP